MKVVEAHRKIGRLIIDADVEFESFVEVFQKRLGKFDQKAIAALAGRPGEAAAALKEMEGDQGLMIFFVLDHGNALKMVGVSQKAIRFILGNPLVAIQMTRHDIRAGQYVPLTVIAYEHEKGRVRVEYDQPSSLLGICENEDVQAVAKELDRKLLLVIENVVSDVANDKSITV